MSSRQAMTSRSSQRENHLPRAFLLLRDERYVLGQWQTGSRWANRSIWSGSMLGAASAPVNSSFVLHVIQVRRPRRGWASLEANRKKTGRLLPPRRSSPDEKVIFALSRSPLRLLYSRRSDRPAS